MSVLKTLPISVALMMLVVTPVFALTPTPTPHPSPSPSSKVVGQVKGLYDDTSTDATDSASAAADIEPTPTPIARTTTTNSAQTPVTGTTENTIVLLVGGAVLIIAGLRFSKE